ncbi:MAG: transglycosylase SLT domain-containing protein [Candidatus Dormibacteria bacterium]
MIPNTYDFEIQQATSEFLPFWDFKWLVAQFYQESLLNPSAVSSSGAQGLCQFMPATWQEAIQALNLASDASPFDAAIAIRAGAWYMRQMWNGWPTPRSDDDRRKLSQASYNAGLGNLYRAQTISGSALDYNSIIACLPLVTGQANARQTTEYVSRIQEFYNEMQEFSA